MKIAAFKIEEWMNKYSAKAEYDLTSTCISPLSINELPFSKEIFNTKLDYGDIEGSIRLKNAIKSLYTNCEIENIAITHGAIGANQLVFLSLLESGDEVVSVVPTYQQHYSIPEALGCNVKLYFLKEENNWLPDLNELDKVITNKTKLLCINNPNNPTGLLTEKPLIQKLLDRSRELGVRVLLDECFLDFVPEEEEYSLADLLEEYPGLVILKSFTKLYAIPGLRLGYVLSSDTELLERMQKAGQPWAVSEAAQAAGIAALQAEGFREQTIRLVTEERAFLKKSLEDMGFHVLDGQANYLCFRAQGDENLTERLLKEGILLRSCANYRGLGADYYRTAVRGRAENERLLAALGKVVGRHE